MSIALDPALCSGCGRCVEVCPGGLLALGPDGRARNLSPGECWNCAACVKDCPCGALSLYLAPQIGGGGATMRAARLGAVLRWEIIFPDGRSRFIRVDSSRPDGY
ncbi:MAG: 4Fe-4S binding protein [Desulfovibrio sp.]|jgi:adenylylsulfate reductase subunit B|nr:4Fe-4S binding protein [Desulfovibrio sp.]